MKKYVLLGLVIGNLVWQLSSGRDWGIALDRSYFQAIAILAVWFTERKRVYSYK